MRKTIPIFLILCSLFTLAACAGTGSGAGTSTDTAAPRGTTSGDTPTEAPTEAETIFVDLAEPGEELSQNGETRLNLVFDRDLVVLPDGTLGEVSDWKSTGYIPIREGVVCIGYNVSCNSTLMSVALFDNQLHFISGVSGGESSRYEEKDGFITVPEGAAYIRFANYERPKRAYAKAGAVTSTFLYPSFPDTLEFKPAEGRPVIACIGDSLTEGDYGGQPGVANVHKENYPLFLAEYLNCTTHNFGKCGYTAETMLAYCKAGSVKLDGADLIVIMLGTNAGLPEKQQTAYRELLTWVQTTAPGVPVVLCVPPYATTTEGKVNYGYAPNVESAAAVVPALAAEFGLPVIDVYAESGFGPVNEDVNQPGDGLHFRTLGYARLAVFIGDKLRGMYPDMFR